MAGYVLSLPIQWRQAGKSIQAFINRATAFLKIMDVVRWLTGGVSASNPSFPLTAQLPAVSSPGFFSFFLNLHLREASLLFAFISWSVTVCPWRVTLDWDASPRVPNSCLDGLGGLLPSEVKDDAEIRGCMSSDFSKPTSSGSRVIAVTLFAGLIGFGPSWSRSFNSSKINHIHYWDSDGQIQIMVWIKSWSNHVVLIWFEYKNLTGNMWFDFNWCDLISDVTKSQISVILANK